MLNRSTAPLFLFLFIVFPVMGQTPSLGELEARIEQARKDFDVPGLAVAIVKDDRVVLSRGFGIRETEKDEPVDDKTLFAIASNTKAFTATLLAILADEGTVSWNDPVQSYLPWFELYDPYVSADVRIADLLCHRVGLGTFSGDLIWYGTPYSREEVVKRARHLSPAFPFRGGYGYSNIMYLAAGEVIEEATGRTWEDEIRDRILDPLGMDHTVLSVGSLGGRDNVATPHKNGVGDVRPLPWYGWDNMVPAGGIISCVSDMSAWMRLVLNRGVLDGERIYSDEQARKMLTPHASFFVSGGDREQNPHTNFSGYGLGWSLRDYDGYLVARHGGGYDGMFSQTLLVPDLKLGIVVLTNSMTGISGTITSAVLDAYLEKSEKDHFADGLFRHGGRRQREIDRWRRYDSLRVEGTNPSFPLSGYEGTYGGPMYGDATVSVEDGSLVLRLLPNPELVGDLTHWHHDVFEVVWRTDFAWFGRGKIQFLMNNDGKIREFTMDIPNDDFWFNELEFIKK